MFSPATLLYGFLAASIVFYVCLQTALTIFEVKNDEASANSVPVAFRQRVTLAEHRKAVDYTGEIIQSDLVSALIGAGLAIALTFGGGFTLLLAGTTALFGQGVGAQFAMVCIVILALTIVDLPISWWKNFRINERYGFEKTPCWQWLKERLLETLAGCLTALPVILCFTVVLMSASYHWWVFAFVVTLCWFVWRFIVVPNWFVGFSKESKPLEQSALRDKIAHLLSQTGHPSIEIYTADRPAGWKHGHATLARRPGKERLVLFNHLLENLDDEEILAVAACAVGRVNRWHTAARLAFFTSLAFVFWWGFAWFAEQEFFYRALNIEPALAIPGGSVNLGLLFSLGLTVFPIALYPMVFVIHAFTRMLRYDEDAYAVRVVGAKPFVRAIAKLHKDFRNSLTPNRLYSLANHRRPHVTHRIEWAFVTAALEKRHSTDAAYDEQKTRAMLYNVIMDKRRVKRNEHLALRLQLKSEKLREAANLRTRHFSLRQAS